jgi:hypothetical protein
LGISYKIENNIVKEVWSCKCLIKIIDNYFNNYEKAF